MISRSGGGGNRSPPFTTTIQQSPHSIDRTNRTIDRSIDRSMPLNARRFSFLFVAVICHGVGHNHN
jgi:hypothetical protein